MDYVVATLVSLRNLLSSSRGGNTELLPLLEAKMQSILGLGIPRRPLDAENDAQVMRSSYANVEGIPYAEGISLQSREVLTALSVQSAAQVETQSLWTNSDLLELFDLTSRLTDNSIELGQSAVETSGEIPGSERWVLGPEIIDINGLVQ